MNLSEISYIGSSNSIQPIPEAILSRIKVIEVGYPAVDSLQQLYTSILNRALRDDYGIDGISVSVTGNFKTAVVSNLSPRVVRNNAGRILSVALKSSSLGDKVKISGEQLLSLIHLPRAEPLRGIGFLADIQR